MSAIARIGLVALLLASFGTPTFAREEAPVVAAQSLVSFASDEGLARLARSNAKSDFAALANQFEAQSNALFCGPTTAAIVLNSVNGRRGEAPRDRSRLRPEDLVNVPAGLDPSLPRYTQDNVIDKGRKTRAQVLGETMMINGKPIKDFGYQVRQLDDMLKGNGLATRLVIAADDKPEAQIRDDLIGNLKQAGDYAVVNYRREAVGQRGGGHISPLGAYDAESDSVLVLDVNPAAAGWAWTPLTMLVKAMRTFDTVENRGYILVRPQ